MDPIGAMTFRFMVYLSNGRARIVRQPT